MFSALALFRTPALLAGEGADTLAALTKANDENVQHQLAQPGRNTATGRPAGGWLMAMAAAYGDPHSSLHHDARLLPAMDRMLSGLERTQLEDGLYDVGNLDSPPDSAFIEETMCKAQWCLVHDGDAATAALRDRLKAVIVKAAGGIVVGGIHTPNHRWEVSSALADVNELYPDQKYVARIEDWLGEGLDIDADGEWAERSPNYSSAVVDPSLLNIGLLLHKPELLEAVQKNLAMTIYHTEPDGEVETVASRRQDQRPPTHKYIWEYYTFYRYFAIRDGNPAFAALARWIQQNEMEDLTANAADMNSALVWMLQIPDLQRDLPTAEPGLPADYSKYFPLTALGRMRHGALSATIYGGSDRHAINTFDSGLATNPAFFKVRKGRAILDAVRMTPTFFSTGHFYSEGLTHEGDLWHLQETRKVPYHLPLPASARRPDGEYQLSPDGRYYSRLSFGERPSDYKTLTMAVDLKEAKGGFELTFDVSGYPHVPVTIELTFRPGGKLEGVERIAAEARDREAPGTVHHGRGEVMDSGNQREGYVLKQGFGSYTVGSDRLEFGPGVYQQAPGRMESEAITWLNGNLRIEGEHVYLTGLTPFHHVLSFR